MDREQEENRRKGTTLPNPFSNLGPFGCSGYVVLAVFLITLLILFFSGAVGNVDISSLIGQNTRTRPGGPSGPDGSNNFATCSYHRGNLLPQGATYNSPQLLSYIQEAADASGVPAVVLAAIARVESPNLVNLTDENISSYVCPESVDGALGPLQIVSHFSHRTDAICQECIAKGAEFLGKAVSELTRDDYCNLESGFKIGAGFILVKMRQNLGGNGTWNPEWTTDRDAINTLARSFYGCLGYPSCSSGPYNYGDDVWNSVNNCRAGPGPIASGGNCPIEPVSLTCGSQMTPINGALGLCGHCGVGYGASCSHEGTKYAIDIDGEVGDNVFLPTVGGETIKWTFFYEDNKGGGESILGYGGEDPESGETYYLQLHHMASGSQNRNIANSGELAGRLCSKADVCHHLHLQIGSGATGPNTTTWLDAPQFVCLESDEPRV